MMEEPDLSANRAWDAAHEEWKATARRCMAWLATHTEFTVDDFWDAMESYYPELTTPEPRAVGAIFRAMAREGLIRKTDRHQKSRRPVRHKGDVAVWEGQL